MQNHKLDTMKTFRIFYESPVETLELVSTETFLMEIKFGAEKRNRPEQTNAILDETRRQLDAYFAGRLKQFSIPLLPQGTPFQKEVWQALRQIPFGKTASYGEIASAINNPKAVRAVGLANSKNPIPIIIPCHRVIGKNGKMTGFAGGLWRKEWLLQHEGVTLV